MLFTTMNKESSFKKSEKKFQGRLALAAVSLLFMVISQTQTFAHTLDEESAQSAPLKQELISQPAMPTPAAEELPVNESTNSIQEDTANSAHQDFSELTIPYQYFQATVQKVILQGQRDFHAGETPRLDPYQILEVKITNGSDQGKVIQIENGSADNIITTSDLLNPGDTVVLAKTKADPVTGESNYFIYDQYRLPAVLIITLIFIALVIVFGRKRGFTSLLGLAFTILVLMKFIVPGLVQGQNPLLISFAGAVIIAVSSLYLAHGFNRDTTIALGSTLVTLTIAIVFAYLFTEWSRLSGIGSEEAYYLQFGPYQNINLKGLFLGGVIIGVLGVLDDITVGQTAAIHQIKKANPSLGSYELYKRGLIVGREHIASLVNTLVLAYAGVSLPLFLMFTTDQLMPLWVNINSEMIVEEIIRTLVGSSALVFAVPISTFFAARFLAKKQHA